MTHYKTSYEGLSREDADKKACEDAKDYLGEDRYKLFVDAAKGVENGTAEYDINFLFFSLDMAGVRGFPVKALLRTHCLNKYREWMHAGDNGEAPVMTDERGYELRN